MGQDAFRSKIALLNIISPYSTITSPFAAWLGGLRRVQKQEKDMLREEARLKKRDFPPHFPVQAS